MDDAMIVIGIIVGIALGFVAGLTIFSGDKPTAAQNFAIVCEYEGGTVQGDVCIEDDRVITINLPGGN